MSRPLAALALAAGLALGGLAAAPAPARAVSDIKFYPAVPIPGLVEAVGGQVETRDGRSFVSINVNSSTLAKYIAQLYRFFMGAAAVVALFMVTYGGLLWLLAGGNQSKVSEAKERISGALTGLLLLVVAYSLLASISGGLVHFRSLSVDPLRGRPLAGGGGEEVESAHGNVSRNMNVNQNDYDEVLDSTARTYLNAFNIQCSLLKAIMINESSGDPRAVSDSNPPAYGLMQIKLATAREALGQSGLTADQLYDPQTNVQAAAAYLARLWSSNTYPASYSYCQRFGSTLKPQSTWTAQDRIAAYHGGPGANCISRTCPGKTFWECQQNPGYASTRAYVLNVQNTTSVLAGSAIGQEGVTQRCGRVR